MKHVKQEFDKLTFKELFSYSLALVCMASANTAIFISLYLPPEGEIHPSILTFFGLSSALAGSLIGITVHFSNELTKFKAEILRLVERKDAERKDSTSEERGEGVGG